MDMASGPDLKTDEFHKETAKNMETGANLGDEPMVIW